MSNIQLAVRIAAWRKSVGLPAIALSVLVAHVKEVK
jgi:hypothetical protein